MGIGIGLIMGTAIGVLLDNIALCVGIGFLIGLIYEIIFNKDEDDEK
ncbi:hypothetical protein [Arcanobacterium hippocoleae]|uniref:Glycine zipper-like domain-containing protein n=1 Tax=Arcanobacterium hippocoleae TaxID=149017 RepID=A0ABU1SZL0_9ACTO|nr:hypothetical protein [Arcanobacterium hippocoleae]MDR6938488.1 hypothetical protein [Arcanobacterium hippocoleae]